MIQALFLHKIQLPLFSTKVKPFVLLMMLSFSFSKKIVGQVDSLYILAKVEISASPLRSTAIGATSQHWDTKALEASQASDIAELLAENSPVFIKSYGIGSLATSSLRGGSAGHTAILWNGLPIQSPMLGLMDLSLLPLAFSEKISLQKGGGAAHWGSGAIGGTLSMDNTVDFSNRFTSSVHSKYGSFGVFEENIGLKIGTRRFQSHSKFLYEKAENNFPFRPHPSLPIQHQSNASLQQKGFLQSVFYNINTKNELSSHLWQQNTNRALPPTLTQNRSTATQDDKSTRFSINYKNQQEKGYFQAKSAYFLEKIHYKDSIQVIDAPSKFETFLSELEGFRRLNQHQNLAFGAIFSHTTAEATGYPAGERENRFALFMTHRLFYKKWQIQTSARQAWVGEKTIPIMPRLGLAYLPFSSSKIRASFSRNYRLPTLNDRFWQPGGNPDLRPENGWSMEIGVDFDHSIRNYTLKSSSTVYNRRIKDWILWHRPDGQIFWGATNIAAVWSRGIEQNARIQYQKNQFKLDLDLQYALTHSTNQRTLNFPKIEAGAQLLYTPIHKTSAQFSIDYKTFKLSIQQQWTSAYKGTAGDLAAFSLTNVRFQYSKQFWDADCTFFIKFNNLFNTTYQVVENRPMPGRHFLLGLRLDFKK